jgi:hypothetical protein
MMDIMIFLLKNNDNYVRQLLDQPDKRKYVKYLINYLQESNLVLPHDIEQDFKIQERVYLFLNYLIAHPDDKHREDKVKDVETHYKLLKFIDFRVLAYNEIIDHILNPINSNRIKEDNDGYLRIINHFLLFLKGYMSCDKGTDLIHTIKSNCPNISKFLITIVRNKRELEYLNLNHSVEELWEKIFKHE